MSSLTEIETLDHSLPSSRGGERRSVGLTLLCHPDARRVGEVCILFSADFGGLRKLSRLEPEFRSATRAAEPLGTPLVSRKALVIRTTAEGQIRLETEDPSLQVAVEGQLLTQPLQFEATSLQRGLAIELGSAVLVLLHYVLPPPVRTAATQPAPASRTEGQPPEVRELLGESVAIQRVKDEIARVADTPVSVLIRGATGTGKELVARAIHAASPRREGPFIAVNMAAIPESVAPSALFGHGRGAFTGAQGAAEGYFTAANGGTLLLDEIGETPRSIQVMLLRAIREGEIQPLGATGLRKVDVRVLTATDAALEHLVEAGEFSEALLQRIAGYTITLPLLRDRRDDIARLFYEFLRQDLERFGESDKLQTQEGAQPFVPAALVRLIVSHGFAGNVAELKALATRVAIAGRGRSQLKADPALVGVLPSAAPAVSPTPTPQRRNPGSVTDAEIVQAMRKVGFSADAAARELGVSRAWLFTRLESCAGIRMAKSLSADEVRAAGEAQAWNVASMAQALEVSLHALRLRMAQLGVSK